MPTIFYKVLMKQYPYSRIETQYFETKQLNEILDYLKSKIVVWESGLDIPSPTDNFTYNILKDYIRRQVEPESVS